MVFIRPKGSVKQNDCASTAHYLTQGPLQNEKPSHNMETRYRDFYEVYNANTERLKNSPIITMQKLLNEEKTTKQMSRPVQWILA